MVCIVLLSLDDRHATYQRVAEAKASYVLLSKAISERRNLGLLSDERYEEIAKPGMKGLRKLIDEAAIADQSRNDHAADDRLVKLYDDMRELQTRLGINPNSMYATRDRR